MYSKIGIKDGVEYRIGKATQKPGRGRFYDFGAKLWRPMASFEKVSPRSNVHTKLIGPDGRIKYEEIGENLVTDYGDEHIARRIYDDTFDIVSGMRLGDFAVTPTTEAKNGANSALRGYVTGSQEALDATPTHSDKGAGSGYRLTHVCTWIAGDITNSALSEVVLTDETPLTDTAGVSGDTVAIYYFAATIDKQAGDSLEVTWHIDILGA